MQDFLIPVHSVRTSTVASSAVELEALVAQTPEHTKHVLTPSVHTKVAEHLTFVNIYSNNHNRKLMIRVCND